MGKTVSRVLLPKAAQGQAKALEVVKAFPVGSIPGIVGEDVKKLVGRPIQGLIIKIEEAKKVLADAKESLEKKKIDSILLTMGVCGKDLILLAKCNAWEKSGTLVAGYTDIIEKQKEAPTGVVVNLDPGDDVIDKSSNIMAKKLGTTAVKKEGVGAKLVGLTGDIVLLAHGDEGKTSKGQIYGKDFAGKSASSIVDLLTKNKDVTKRLMPDYAGTVYLDGCFTAQGSAMKNYTQQVWNGLKGAGIPNVKVMGNLGLSATNAEGDEIVNPSIESEAVKKQIAALKLKTDTELKKISGRQQEIISDCKKKGLDFKVNDEYVKLKQRDQQLNKQYNIDRAAIVDKAPVDVKNLVGKFGLSTVN